MYIQVRKLEFIFAEIVRRGCRHVITCGGIQSNHCRATAVAASELGIKCHLFLRGDVEVIKLEKRNNIGPISVLKKIHLTIIISICFLVI